MIIPVILLILFSLDIPDILVHRLVALVSGFSDIIAFANLKVLGIVSSCLLTLFFLLPKKIPIGFHTIRKIPFLSGLCLFLLCLGLLLGKITIFVPSPGQLERYMGLSSVSNTYGSRGFYTINALREWRSAPLIGNGLGAVVFGSSHNLYIDFLAKTGILGVFSLLLFGFNLSRGTWLVLRSQFWMQDHALGILLCLLYYAIYSFSQTHYLQFYIWTIFGLALSLQRLIYKEFSPESREKASARMEDASRSRPSSIAGNALSIT